MYNMKVVNITNVSYVKFLVSSCKEYEVMRNVNVIRGILTSIFKVISLILFLFQFSTFYIFAFYDAVVNTGVREKK